MVGNEEERDVFQLENTSTIIVDKFSTYEQLIDNYNKITEAILNFT